MRPIVGVRRVGDYVALIWVVRIEVEIRRCGFVVAPICVGRPWMLMVFLVRVAPAVDGDVGGLVRCRRKGEVVLPSSCALWRELPVAENFRAVY